MKSVPIAILVAILLAGGCAHGTTASGTETPAHSARNALDWAGAYHGILPCADCEGIDSVVVLGYDGTYSTGSKYLGKDSQVFREQGRFTWNKAGDTITFSGSEPAKYFVSENYIVRLAMDGSRITGTLAEHYVLDKIPAGIIGRTWTLIELQGQRLSALERVPYMTLSADNRRLKGFAGCNTFTGSYTLDEADSRVRFAPTASTRMACLSGMDVEQAFHDVLQVTDNYSIKGNVLTLRRGQMPALARFETSYLR